MRGTQFLCLIAAMILTGCASGPQQPSPAERQDAALKDPMNYKPSVGGDVSGGGIMDFDQRGFGSDLHDVLNP
jgi:hypothetical protein